jgi:hypothetical protein
MILEMELEIIENPNTLTAAEIKNILWEKCADLFNTGDNFTLRCNAK